MLAATTTTNSGGGGIGFIVIAVFAIVIVVFIRRVGQRRAGLGAQAPSQAVIGSEVMTGSGLYGTVVGQDDEQVLLEIAPGVQVRFARAAIARVIEAGDPTYLEAPDDGPPDPPEDAVDPPGDTAP